VRFQADCDYHVQVASSRAATTPEVIVEIPRAFEDTQEELMKLLNLNPRRNLST
jgi:hypothetical protein